ncbi:MAG: GH3 auxin-responsive promoter family protein [Candidatus Tritonobacter lacicola]|nr:GH3 auxin-responsive promoter family protein [Candidatus Tritonobacter lacicola]
MIRKLLLKAFKIEAARFAAAFDRLTKEPLRTQEEVLLRKVRRNENTLFGREHGFGKIAGIADFRRNVRICHYDEFAPYVKRIVGGERNVLFSETDRLLMFALTSGTTVEPKYIPVTESFLSEYRRGWMIWVSHVMKKYPGFLDRKILPIASPTCEHVSHQGIRCRVPCGSMSGLSMERQRLAPRLLYAVPTQSYHVKDELAKYYTVMRLAIEHSITTVMSPNPSTHIAVARVVDEFRESIIRDVRDGTISSSFELPGNIRGDLSRFLKPNPGRARELEAIVDRSGKLMPKDYWSDIVLLACWKGGAVHHFLDLLPKYYPEVPAYEMGLIASEGRVSIPVSDEGRAGVLDIGSHFFEFIPEEQEESPDPDAYLSHELEVGGRYFVVMTTSSGLCRYNLHDLIEVVGFYNATPVVAFLNKGKHISSMTGEKVSEYQIVSAVHRCASRFAVGPCVFTLVPTWNEVPYYRLLIEEEDLGDGASCGEFIRAIDMELMKLNMEYDGKRRSGRLGGMRLAVIRAGSFGEVRQRKVIYGGVSPEQYKHCYLVPDGDYGDRFTVLREVCFE